MNPIENLERKLDQLLREPDNSELINEIGVILYQMKDWKNAEIYLQRAYQMNPNDDDILYNYAFILYFDSKWEKAIPILKTYLSLNPDEPEIIKKLGDSYYHLGEYEPAAAMYEQLRKKGESGS